MRKSTGMQLKLAETKKDGSMSSRLPESLEQPRPPPNEPLFRWSKVSHRYSSHIPTRAASPLPSSTLRSGVYPISHIVKEPDFRHMRPISAPYQPGSVLTSVRRTEVANSRESNTVAIQEESVKRLYRGSRVTLIGFSDITDNPIFKLSDYEEPGKTKEVEKLQMRKDAIQHRAFVQSFQVFRDLVFDLDFNFDVSRDKSLLDSTEAEIPPGELLALQEAVLAMTLEAPDSLQYSRESLATALKDYTQHVRSLLRVLRAKGLNTECSLLETLWKLVTKTVDNSVVVHGKIIEEAVEMAKYKVRDEIEKRRKLYDDMNQRMEREERALREQLEKQAEHIKALLTTKQSLEQHLEERQTTITKLQSVTTREESVKEMTSFYSKMDRYLAEAESEQVKQLATLEDISTIMELVNKLDEKHPCESHDTQTEWSINDLCVALPLVARPQFSLHPYYQLLLTVSEVPQLAFQAVAGDFESLFDSEVDFAAPKPIYLRLLAKAAGDTRSAAELAKKLAGICDTVLKAADAGDHRGIMYSHLLGLKQGLPSAPELAYFFNLRNALKRVEVPEGAPLVSVLDIIQQGFADSKAQGCSLLEKLRIAVPRPTLPVDGSLSSYVQNEALAQAPPEMMTVLSRLALAMEKQKKSWKSQIEAMDPHKSGVVNIGQIIEHVSGLLWVSDAEVGLLTRFFDKKESGQVRVGDAIQAFDVPAFQQTAHKAFVAPDLFLRSALEVWREHALDHMPAALPTNDYTLFAHALRDTVAGIEDLEVARIFASVCGQLEDWREVLITFGTFNKFEVKEIKKTEKKGKGKRRK